MKQVTDARMVHATLAKTAKEMAGAYYEIAASKDNAFYRAWPNQGGFIQQNWRHFVMTAREVLTEMLRRNTCSDHMKAEIYDALLLDAQLPYSVQEHQILNVPH
jgi:hypothetical protein